MINPPIHLRILAIFLLQATINWLYVLWINSQSDLIISAWIALSSLLGFMYVAFIILAAIGIYNKSIQGLVLAYCVIIFGIICDVISYGFVYRSHYLIEVMIIPIIILNVCVAIYIALHQRDFK